MDKKKVIYIGSLFILTVIVSITYFSYAFFTHRDEQRGKLNIVTGTLDYKLSSTLLDNTNSITLASGEKARLNIKIKSLNEIASKYELFYTTTNNEIEIGYNTNHDLPIGTIDKDGIKMVTVIIKNKTASQAKVTFGVEGGFTNNTLAISSGSHLTEYQGNYCEIVTNTVFNFSYTGNYQEFKPVCSGDYKVELWGASSGYDSGYYTYGSGAYVSGKIQLSEDDTLYAYVGGVGDVSVSSTYVAGGYNGGGASSYHGTHRSSASGGGATDIRLVSGNWNDAASLRSRIMVAAGGSGGAAWSTGASNQRQNGTNAGGISGYDGKVGYDYNSRGKWMGYAGTQVSGGLGGYNELTQNSALNAGFGYGGVGNTTSGWAGGGGGSGWYGGGAAQGYGASAGSGSSYISGHTGCVAVSSTNNSTPKTGCSTGTTNQECSYSPYEYTFSDTNMIDGSGYSWTNIKENLEQMPNPNGSYYTSGVGHAGHGYARITYLTESLEEEKVDIKNYRTLIPVMTSNTAPSGTASGSSLASQYYDHYYAFCDGTCISNTPGNAWVPAINDTNPYIQYEFPTAVMAKKATVHLSQTYVTGGASPTYTIKASNDNVNWTTLTDVVTGTLSEVEIDLSNNSSYQYYRLQFNQSINQSSSVGTWRVYKLQLYGY